MPTTSLPLVRQPGTFSRMARRRTFLQAVHPRNVAGTLLMNGTSLRVEISYCMTGDGKGYQQARARPSSHNIFRSLTEVNPRTNRISPLTMSSKKEKERKTILNRTRLSRWVRQLRFDLPASRRRRHQLNRTPLSYQQLRLSQQLQLSPHPQSNLFVRPVRKHPLLPP